MKNWSIKRKLTSLSASLLGLMLVVGSVQFYGAERLKADLYDAYHIYIPIAFDVTLLDMAHDGLNSIVFRSLYVASTNNEELKKEVAQDLKDTIASMQEHFANIDKVKGKFAAEKEVSEARPEIEMYIKQAEEVVALSLSGHQALASQKIEAFSEKFKDLEEKLEKLGDLVNTHVTEASKKEDEFANLVEVVSLALMIFGLLVGIFTSVVIIKNLMKTLTDIISRLTESNHQVSSASKESSSSASKLSEAATEQAASLQETMASVEEISAMVSQNAESANKAKAAVDQNQNVSNEGAKSVGQMIAAIDEIKSTNDEILSQMETSNKEFSEIVKIISEIGNKTKVINDIVFQTKLLSFNASVEAARAGEHGKGFAVVAEEVGNLAQMSGNAAKEITDMLSDSIKKVNEIVENTTRRVDQLVETGKDKIAMGQSTAQKCREALDRIAENAHSVASMVTEITHASKEQAQGIQEINKAIGQLDQVTQQNSAVAQRSSSQATQLNSEASSLSDSIDQLVHFVDGVQADARATENKNQRQSTPEATVISFPAKRSEARQHSSTVKAKQVVNSSETPSSNDPSFEEF